MASLETIRRIRIEATATGTEQAAASLNQVAEAQQRVAATGAPVAAVTETISRRQLSAASSYDRLRKSIDDAYRSEQMYARGRSTIDRAVEQGLASPQQAARDLALLNQRYIANDNLAKNAAKSTGLAAHQMQNLGFQINDVVSGLAMGQSPFTILAQQGGQVSQILSSAQGGVGGALRGIKDNIVGLVGPAGLAVGGIAALGAAAYVAYRVFRDEGRSVEDLLQEQARLLAVVREAYDSNTAAAARWAQQSKNVTDLQALSAEIELRKKLKEQTNEALFGRGGVLSAGANADDTDAVTQKYQAFSSAIEKLNAGIKAGSPDLRAYTDEIAKIGLSSPELRKAANELITMISEAEKTSTSLQKLQDMRDVIAGIATEAQKARLGIKEVFNPAEDVGKAIDKLTALAPKANEALITANKIKEIQALFSGAMAAINRSEMGPVEVKNLTDMLEKLRSNALGEVNKESVSAYDTLVQRTQDRVKELQLEAQQAGMTADAVIKLKTAHDLERAAKSSSKAITEDMREEWRKLGEQMAEATRQRTQANIKSGVEFELKGLGMGISDREMEIARQLRPIYNDITTALNSNEAAMLHNVDAIKEARDSTKEFASTFLDGLRQGKTAAEAFGNALTKISNRIVDRALDQMITGLVTGSGGSASSGGVPSFGINASMSSLKTGFQSLFTTVDEGREAMGKFNGNLSDTNLIFEDGTYMPAVGRPNISITPTTGTLFNPADSTSAQSWLNLSKGEFRSTLTDGVKTGTFAGLDRFATGSTSTTPSGAEGGGVGSGVGMNGVLGVAAVGGAAYGAYQSGSPLGGAISGALAGAIAGQMLIPIPVVGAMIGAVLGAGAGASTGPIGDSNGSRRRRASASAVWAKTGG